MAPLPSKEITRHQILEYMAALYAENPDRPDLQPFLSDIQNYATYIGISCPSRSLHSSEITENPAYHLSKDVTSLFSELKLLSAEQLKALLEKYHLEDGQNAVLQSAKTLYQIETAAKGNQRHAIKDGVIQVNNVETREIKDYHTWYNIPDSMQHTFLRSSNSTTSDRLNIEVRDNYLIVNSATNQYAVFDAKKNPGNSILINLFESDLKLRNENAPEERNPSADWKVENNKIYVNMATKVTDENWVELKLAKDDKQGTLLIPGRAPWALTLNQPLTQGKPVDATVHKDQLAPVVGFSIPDAFSDLVSKKEYLDTELNALDDELKEFAAKNKAAILGDQTKQENQRQQRYKNIIDSFGDEYKNFKNPDYLEEYYGPLFKDTPELRPMFDIMYKSHELLNEKLRKITNPADQDRVLEEVMKRYYDPSSNEYLLRDVAPEHRERLNKVFDILRNYKNNPKLKDRTFEDVLHQIDWELKDRLLPKENNQYRMPLNSSQCPACDTEFREIIDNILKEQGVIVSNTKLPVIDVKGQPTLSNVRDQSIPAQQSRA